MSNGSAQIHDDARCIDCGYALRGLTGSICPECGRAFELGDSTTYRMPRQILNWNDWAQSPSLLTFVVIIGLMVRAIYLASTPIAGDLRGVIEKYTPLIVGSVIVDFLFRIVACRVVSIRSDGMHSLKRKRRNWRWIVLPLCLAIIGSTRIGHWPMKLRFRVSRPAFEQMQERIESGAAFPRDDFWLGLYNVYIDFSDGMPCYVLTGGRTRMYTPYGFCRGDTIRPEFSAVEHVMDDWYVISFTGYPRR